VTKYEYSPETLAEKDVTYIREEYKKNSTMSTMKRLAKQYNVSVGRIQWYLGALADEKRERDKQLIAKKIMVEKGKQTEERRKRKFRKNEGIWKLPSTIVKSLELKTNAEQDKILFEHYLEYRSLCNFVKEGEARKKETKQPYDYVKKYRITNESCKAHWLGGCVNIIVNTVIPSSIRGIYSGKISFPVSGKQSPKTSGEDIKVIKKNGKYWLLFADMEIEILYQNHDEYYSKGIKCSLHEYWEDEIYHGGWIRKAKNKKWYWQIGIPRAPSNYQWNENLKVFIVIQPILNDLGIVWNARFFNMKNQLIYKACILHSKSTVRITSKAKDYRTWHVRNAIKRLFRIWHEKFGMLQPVVILQNTIGKAPSQESETMNPTFILEEKLKNKLAEVNGIGANILDVEPYNIEKIRSRLSL